MDRPFQFRFPYAEFPAVRVVVCFAAGVICAMQDTLVSPYLIHFVPVLALSCLWYDRKSRSALHPGDTALSIMLYSLLLFIFGAVHYETMKDIRSGDKRDLINLYSGKELRIRGVVRSARNNDAGKLRADLEIRGIYGQSGWMIVPEFKARLLADNELLTEGDTLEALVQDVPIGEKRNPSDFDYRKYLEKRGIYKQIRLLEISRVSPLKNRWTWTWWRLRSLEATSRIFTKDTTPVAKALLLGYKNDLEQEQRQAYARAGLSHIMAVSGLHVGFLIAPLWLLIPWLRRSFMGRLSGLTGVALLLLIYGGITGFSPSVMRASVTALFLIYGSLFHRAGDSLNLTAAAAFVLLLIDPSQIEDVGFQLSFGAVYTILLVMPVVQRKMPYRLRIAWYGKPVMAGIISVVVQFGLYPLQAYYFGEMSLISPLANMLFIPFLGLIIPVSVLSVLIWMISPAVSAILAYGSIHFLGWMNDFVHLIPGHEWTWTTVDTPSVWVFPLWVTLLALIKAGRIPQIRWKWLITALMCILGIQLSVTGRYLQNQNLEILFFDVGQGDAALIKTPNGKHILIDTGLWSPGYNSGTSVILPHLHKKGVGRLDAIVLSHPHADHIGGTTELLGQVPVGAVYNSGFEYESALYRRYLEIAEEKKIAVHSVTSGDSLLIDPAVLILILGPDGNIHGDDPNEHSVIVRVQYGDTAFLFTGDAGEHQEDRILNQYGDLIDTDVLKVGHHGSRTSSHEPFLRKSTPGIAVVSLAKRNKFGHPHAEAVERLRQTGAELLFTSREKAVWLTSDGSMISRKNWN